MNTEEIVRLISSHEKTAAHFDNVYPSDLIPKRENFKEKKFLIANLDPSWSSGSHWVGFLINPFGPSEYFDSYGKKPPYDHFENLLGKDYYYNSRQLQYNLSTACGQWCIFFIWERVRGTNYNDLVNYFHSEDFLLNDHMMNRAIEIVFKTDLKVINKKFLCQQICKSLENNLILNQQKL